MECLVKVCVLRLIQCFLLEKFSNGYVEKNLKGMTSCKGNLKSS
jgi:hypothetical protein